MSPNRVILVLLLVAALGATVFIFRSGGVTAPGFVRFTNSNAYKAVLLPLSANGEDALTQPNSFALTPPVAQFRERITKKTFGMYITPGTSPIQNDRFTGYHTGVDAEFTDTGTEIPITAIADGIVIVSTWANGYGGVVVVQHSIRGAQVYALYGHLAPDSLIPTGTRVTRGQLLGVLGDDHSSETDGARKHLHFSLYSGETANLRGYVSTETELTDWLDPLEFF